MHLRVRPGRHVETIDRWRPEQRLLLRLEDLSWDTTCRAVDASVDARGDPRKSGPLCTARSGLAADVKKPAGTGVRAGSFTGERRPQRFGIFVVSAFGLVGGWPFPR
jgi:hypothetical protein